MPQSLGIVDIYWNGSKLDNEPGASVTLGGVVNAPVIASRKVLRAQKMTMGEVTCSVPVEEGQRVTDSYGNGTGELQVKCDTGQIFLWEDAFLVDPRKFTANGDGGKLALKWNCGTPVEL